MYKLTDEEALELSRLALIKAREIHPRYPSDLIHRSAIINEEAGELTQACINHYYFGGDNVKTDNEALHVIATALRFLTER